MEGMDEDADKRRVGRRVSLALVIVLALLVLYALSIGPALWLAFNGYLGYQTFDVVYWPLISIAHVFPAIKDALDWYCPLWER
jgi:hypothetical protein